MPITVFSVGLQGFRDKKRKSINSMTVIETDPKLKMVTIMKSSYLATVYVRNRLKLDMAFGINGSNRISYILKISSGDNVSFIIIVCMWQLLLVSLSLFL
jgi:inner membrane protein involved in colicin E2 resistance